MCPFDLTYDLPSLVNDELKKLTKGCFEMLMNIYFCDELKKQMMRVNEFLWSTRHM